MKHGCCRAGFEREEKVRTARDGETGQRRGGRGDVRSHGTAISARLPIGRLERRILSYQPSVVIF